MTIHINKMCIVLITLFCVPTYAANKQKKQEDVAVVVAREHEEYLLKRGKQAYHGICKSIQNKDKESKDRWWAQYIKLRILGFDPCDMRLPDHALLRDELALSSVEALLDVSISRSDFWCFLFLEKSLRISPINVNGLHARADLCRQPAPLATFAQEIAATYKIPRDVVKTIIAYTANEYDTYPYARRGYGRLLYNLKAN